MVVSVSPCVGTAITAPASPPSPVSASQAEWSSAEVRGSQKDTVTVGHAEKESIMGVVVIIDPFPAWKPPLCHKDTAKGKKCSW